MLTLDELAKKNKIKFIKSEHRPWNYKNPISKNSIHSLEEQNQDLNNNASDFIPKLSEHSQEFAKSLNENQQALIQEFNKSQQKRLKKAQEKTQLDELLSSQMEFFFDPAEVLMENAVSTELPAQPAIPLPEQFALFKSIVTKPVESATITTLVHPPAIDDLETAVNLVSRLTGHQQKIFMYIAERCLSRAQLSTGIIQGEALVDLTETTMKMVKTSIQRLVAKGLIIRERGKTGRGGFYSFGILDVVRKATLEYKKLLELDGL